MEYGEIFWDKGMVSLYFSIFKILKDCLIIEVLWYYYRSYDWRSPLISNSSLELLHHKTHRYQQLCRFQTTDLKLQKNLIQPDSQQWRGEDEPVSSTWKDGKIVAVCFCRKLKIHLYQVQTNIAMEKKFKSR